MIKVDTTPATVATPITGTAETVATPKTIKTAKTILTTTQIITLTSITIPIYVVKHLVHPMDLAIFVISFTSNAAFIEPSFVAIWEIAKNELGHSPIEYPKIQGLE